MEKVDFSYHYSAKENREIEEIRAKYLPRTESALEQMRRLDRKVQNAGTVEGLCLGLSGVLIFGIAMCFGLGVFAQSIIAAVIFGIVGTALMIPAYPLYRKISEKTKKQLAPKILELAEELSK